MRPSTFVLMRTAIPIPLVAIPSNKLISISAPISPNISFMYGGGSRRIQLTSAARYTNSKGSSLSTSNPLARVSALNAINCSSSA
ncbi:hypothetical protein [Pseudomonas sp. 25 E 4]|nr:hypothetical protein [Pseudomonas sp. 25 E 4]